MSGGTLELVKERTDIVELIGASVQLKQAGRSFKGLCPFHNEKTPSFVVYPESQSYHCFGCGKTGDVFTFVMETQSLDFRDALTLLAERAGVQLQRREPNRDPEQDREKQRLIELNDRAASYFSSILWTSPAAKVARDTLERRGVDRRTAERFGIGFAPDSFDSLKNYFLSRDAREDELVAAGLLSQREDGRTWDRFRNRITFPIWNRDGQVVGFGARAIGDSNPKYLNSPQTAIFDKSSLLYALDKATDAIRRQRSIVIVEGYMDAIAAHQHGYENVVASMGTALTAIQVSSIRRYVDHVYLALDSDAAGQSATLRGIHAVRDSFADDERPDVRPGAYVRFERTLGAEIRVVLLPSGKDPDEFIRANPDAWPAALEAAVPLVEYVLTNTLSGVERSPTARARALQEYAVPVLREISDATVLSYYVGMTARLLGFKDTEVHAAVLRGPTRRGGVVVREPAVVDRPAARDHERYAIALMLRYPQSGLAHMHLLDRDDVLDARHREILKTLIRTQGDIDVLSETVPQELMEYVEELLSDTEPRQNGLPSVSSQELPQVLQRLAQTRYQFRLRQVQNDLSAARAAGDSDAVAEHVRRMSELALRKPFFDPRESPYFKDSRSEAS